MLLNSIDSRLVEVGVAIVICIGDPVVLACHIGRGPVRGVTPPPSLRVVPVGSVQGFAVVEDYAAFFDQCQPLPVQIDLFCHRL